MMEILQVSDVHGSLDAASKVAAKAVDFDVVLVVGDITHFGAVPQAKVLLETIASSGKPVMFVPGNCDHPSMLSWKPNNKNIVNIHLEKTKLQDYEFIGIGGGNLSPFNTLTEFSEHEFEKMLNTLQPTSPKFILVSHTPPHGVDADYARGKHLGSTAIRTFVEKNKPLLVSCGHIHEARSVSKIGETTVVNAGPAKDGFCAAIEIKDGKVVASLLNL